MSTKIHANIIAERSAGRTALEIYEDDTLVWSTNYFADGASASWYRKGQRQIVDDAMACADWRSFEGGEVDEDGAPVMQDDCETSYALMTYRPGEGWTTEVESLCDGQAETLIQINRDRLPEAIVALLRDET